MMSKIYFQLLPLVVPTVTTIGVVSDTYDYIVMRSKSNKQYVSLYSHLISFSIPMGIIMGVTYPISIPATWICYFSKIAISN